MGFASSGWMNSPRASFMRSACTAVSMFGQSACTASAEESRGLLSSPHDLSAACRAMRSHNSFVILKGRIIHFLR